MKRGLCFTLEERKRASNNMSFGLAELGRGDIEFLKFSGVVVERYSLFEQFIVHRIRPPSWSEWVSSLDFPIVVLSVFGTPPLPKWSF